ELGQLDVGVVQLADDFWAPVFGESAELFVQVYKFHRDLKSKSTARMRGREKKHFKESFFLPLLPSSPWIFYLSAAPYLSMPSQPDRSPLFCSSSHFFSGAK